MAYAIDFPRLLTLREDALASTKAEAARLSGPKPIPVLICLRGYKALNAAVGRDFDARHAVVHPRLWEGDNISVAIA
jgi:hypothetical protein